MKKAVTAHDEEDSDSWNGLNLEVQELMRSGTAQKPEEKEPVR